MTTDSKFDALGYELSRAAMNALVRLCPEIGGASPSLLEEVCLAMRTAAPEVVDQFVADAKAAPWVAKIAFQDAVLTLAVEGARIFRGTTTQDWQR